MKEYSKGIYVKFKPEEVEMIHDRMKESGVQNMSASIRKMVLKRIKQLYVEFYKEKNIEKFRNAKLSIERKAVA